MWHNLPLTMIRQFRQLVSDSEIRKVEVEDSYFINLGLSHPL